MLLAVHTPAAPTAPPPSTEPKPELQVSIYRPTSTRDPLMRPGVVSTGAVTRTSPVVAPLSFPFRLEGILYNPTAPSAVLNDKVVVLNKPVKLTAGHVEIVVTVVEISRDRVVVEAAGQRRELRLASPGSPTKSAP
jgi:hypothetical protein